MKLQGKITLLIDGGGAYIEIKDTESNISFVNVKLTAEQLCSAMGRLAMVECDLEVRGLDKVGKKHEWQSFEFEIPKELASSSKTKELTELAQSKLSDGWVAEAHFSSQNSFFKKDDKQYARCTIRRWL